MSLHGERGLIVTIKDDHGRGEMIIKRTCDDLRLTFARFPSLALLTGLVGKRCAIWSYSLNVGELTVADVLSDTEIRFKNDDCIRRAIEAYKEPDPMIQ